MKPFAVKDRVWTYSLEDLEAFRAVVIEIQQDFQGIEEYRLQGIKLKDKFIDAPATRMFKTKAELDQSLYDHMVKLALDAKPGDHEQFMKEYCGEWK